MPDSMLEGLLQFVTQEDRVCPRPMEWQAFYVSLPGAGRTSEGWSLAPPLILAAWRTSNEAKAARLKDHIEWAARQGALPAADRYLRSLPPEAWHHRNHLSRSTGPHDRTAN